MPGATLHNATMFKHDNFIGVDDCGQTMFNHPSTRAPEQFDCATGRAHDRRFNAS